MGTASVGGAAPEGAAEPGDAPKKKGVYGKRERKKKPAPGAEGGEAGGAEAAAAAAEAAEAGDAAAEGAAGARLSRPRGDRDDSVESGRGRRGDRRGGLDAAPHGLLGGQRRHGILRPPEGPHPLPCHRLRPAHPPQTTPQLPTHPAP